MWGFFSNDGWVIKGFLKNFFFFENFVILSIFLLAVLWIATAVFLLPNRDVDGLCYHLPQIYESILQHRWVMLPLELRSHFAFPFNAELLFLWPAIFFHSQQFVDGVQGVMALFGVFILYALGREWNLTARTSVFIAFLFFLSPVVLAQSGSNYIDLIIAVLFLFAVYFAVSFYKTNTHYDLYNAAMAIGLLAGTKYAMLVFVVSLQIFMIKGLRKMSRIHLGCYIAVIVLLGGYWYLRNWILLGNPIFPVTLGSDGGHFKLYQRVRFYLARKLPPIIFCGHRYRYIQWRNGVGFLGNGFAFVAHLFFEIIERFQPRSKVFIVSLAACPYWIFVFIFRAIGPASVRCQICHFYNSNCIFDFRENHRRAAEDIPSLDSRHLHHFRPAFGHVTFDQHMA